MKLHEITACMHRNDTVTPAMVDAFEYHAAALSLDICDNYQMLNAILLRQEAAIRLRWMRKTVAQRRRILLAAWPDMSDNHRPEFRSPVEQLWSASNTADGRFPDHIVWPFSKSNIANLH